MRAAVLAAIAGTLGQIFFAVGAEAFDEQKRMFTYTPMSCGRFIQVADDERVARARSGLGEANTIITGAYALQAGWAAGYLTAINEYFPGGGNLVNTDMVSTMLFVEKYCRENPLSSFGTGVSELVYKAAPSVRKLAHGD